MNIKQIIKENKEGFTILVKHNNKQLEQPTLITKKDKLKGYCVALTDIKTDINSIEQTFQKCLIIANEIKAKSVFIGGWSDNNNLYLDVGIIINKVSHVAIIRDTFQQKSIFNLNTWECV